MNAAAIPETHRLSELETKLLNVVQAMLLEKRTIWVRVLPAKREAAAEKETGHAERCGHKPT